MGQKLVKRSAMSVASPQVQRRLGAALVAAFAMFVAIGAGESSTGGHIIKSDAGDSEAESGPNPRISVPQIRLFAAPSRSHVQIAALSPDLAAPTSPPARPESEKPALHVEDAPTPLRKTVTIEKGESLITAMTRAGVRYGDAFVAAKEMGEQVDLRKIQIGDTVKLVLGPEIQDADTEEVYRPLIGCELEGRRSAAGSAQWLGESDVAASVIAPFGSPGDAIIEEPVIDTRPEGPVLVSTAITSSVYASAVKAGMSANQVMELIRILQHRVDFQRDLRSGDQLDVYFERTKNDDGEIADGPILFASLKNRGRNIVAYRGVNASGDVEYFDAEGRSNRRLLMRTPIYGARVSSGFGKRRHPILGYSKMHKGIDFAARSGEKILAAGDGVVEKLGWVRGYGRYIRIRHNDTYKTAYAHMRGYKKGMHKGKRVKQGDIIGYVGTTGRSTGPSAVCGAGTCRFRHEY
jgi:murein DD-endopeptidase MepM/ murein hydrolase activator NlpD